MVQIVENLEWELLKNVAIRKSIYARITNTRFMDPLFENFAYITVPTLPFIRPFVHLRRHILHHVIPFVWFDVYVSVHPSVRPQWFPDIT
jgi:hypothetical protein